MARPPGLSLRLTSYPKKWYNNDDEGTTINIHDYTRIASLGSGSYGDVAIYNHTNGKKYALKKMFLDRNTADVIRNESNIMQELNKMEKIEDIIPKIYSIFQTSENTIYFVIEIVEGIELFSIINKHIGRTDILSIKEITKIILLLSKNLVRLHKSGVIHYDIKPENIIFNKKEHVIKFIDYGISCIKAFSDIDCYYEKKGTPMYSPPEAFIKREPSEDDDMVDKAFLEGIKHDVWGFGLIIYLFFEHKTLEDIEEGFDKITYDNLKAISGISDEDEEEMEKEMDDEIIEMEHIKDSSKEMALFFLNLLKNDIFIKAEERIDSETLYKKISEKVKEIYNLCYDIDEKIIKEVEDVLEGGYNKYVSRYLEIKSILKN